MYTSNGPGTGRLVKQISCCVNIRTYAALRLWKQISCCVNIQESRFGAFRPMDTRPAPRRLPAARPRPARLPRPPARAEKIRAGAG